MSALAVPELCLVVLVGASGSGKSTFATTHFLPTQVLSSDRFRGLVSDDENDQAATRDAFEALRFVAAKRLSAGRLTVVDATSVRADDRASLVQLARDHDVLPVAIVLDVPERTCQERNASRTDRDLPGHVVRRQVTELRRGLRRLEREGFRRVHVLQEQDVDGATIAYERAWNDRRDEHGPFDVVGDVHGCHDELVQLLTALGYVVTATDAVHPEGRRAVFVGDLVDRGPNSPGVLRLVMGMVAAGHALCVPGNHESKLVKALRGKKVSVSHGLAETLAQLAEEPPEFRAEVERFCHDLVSHLVLDDGRLVVAHAGLTEAYQGRASARVRAFALYGDTTGETDEFGLPVRYPWAQDYRGRAMVLYGHTPVPEVEWVNGTMCLDTGCVFGGSLTALRYPEKDVVSVRAARTYYEPARPLVPVRAERPTGELRLSDVLGKRVVETRLAGRITVREENAAAALEVMSRFAIAPAQLLYLPPTMSPTETSSLPGLLEHPAEAFAHFRSAGVPSVVCQEKHMGSRAVALVRRDGTGAVWTRTGRSFFSSDLTAALLSRLAPACTALLDELGSDWVLLDAELLPWSAKAGDLIRQQFAAVGAAGRAVMPPVVAALEAAVARGQDVGGLLTQERARLQHVGLFSDAYRRYVWDTDGLDGVQLAPFQVLAAEGASFHDRDHAWHLAVLDRVVEADPALVRRTERRWVDLDDPAAEAAATDWWTAMTAAGGEGMVVKPAANLMRSAKGGLVQPGLKVRGREYLRIIYGPDYTEPRHLERLRQRRLGRKRSLAQREYALGLEGLERLAAGEPLHRVHECVFAVLALESEPVDPRL